MEKQMDVFAFEIATGIETIVSFDEAYMALANYTDLFVLEERMLKGEQFSTDTHVYTMPNT